MAALFGHMEFWNASLKMIVEEIKRGMETISTVEVTAMSLCCLFFSFITVVGNSFVIAAVWKDPLKILKSSATNFILLEMAIADLFVGVVFAPSTAIWYLRLALKEDAWNPLFVVTIFSHFFLIVSVFHVLLLTIDRYYALTKPLNYRSIVTKRRVAIGSLLIWLFCFCYLGVFSMLNAKALVPWFIFVLVIWLCSHVVCCVYMVTLKKLCNHYKTTSNGENSRTVEGLRHQREKKVFVVILSAILVSYFCFLPWMVGNLVFIFCRACHENSGVVILSYHVGTLLLFANSALNPLLYAWRFSKFQATFKYFWTKCSCCSKIYNEEKQSIFPNEIKHWQRCDVFFLSRCYTLKLLAETRVQWR